MTIAVPEKLHGRMKAMSEIRWSEVARKAFEAKIRELELVEKIVSKSKLTQKDVDELSDMIDKEVWEETKKCA